MTGYCIFLVIYALLFICYNFIILFTIRKGKNQDSPLPLYLTNLPKISILVAAKNEEETILRCLTSLSLLDYPVDKFEVLVGNDDSSDTTGQVVGAFIKDHPNFKLIDIKKTLGKARAKANVLAHLAHEALGEYFFVTDADIAVEPAWARSLLPYCHGGVGLVSGSTVIQGQSLFAKFQNLEWVYNFGLIEVSQKLGYPVTAVGNNMVVSREAYFSVGGYENIPFSITEDYQLFKELRAKGWSTLNMLQPNTVNFSLPMHSIPSLLAQRKRWMHGAIHVHITPGLFLVLQALYIPTLILGAYVAPLWTLAFVNIKIGMQFYFIREALKKAGLPLVSFSFHLVYEAYHAIIDLSTLLYFLVPTKVVWKGRKY